MSDTPKAPHRPRVIEQLRYYAERKPVRSSTNPNETRFPRAELSLLPEAIDAAWEWITALESQLAASERWREVIASAGVEFSDPRVGYVTIQIAREDFEAARSTPVDPSPAPAPTPTPI